MSEACRFDQNISKRGDGKKVMIFSDSRTNSSEEGEDDKNHGIPNGPIAKKIQKNVMKIQKHFRRR